MKTQTLKELADKIIVLKSKYAQKLIGIDGGGGAGKSTFAKKLQECIPNSVVVHVDDFYKGPWNARLDHKEYEVNPFFDWNRLNEEVFKPIEEGRPIHYHIYDWHTHTAEKVEVVPSGTVIILEGGYTIQKRFSNLYDFRIWVEADESKRLQKALVRDGEHMRFLWEEDWLPVERNYIRSQNPASEADIVIQGHSGNLAEGTFQIL